MSAPRIVPRPSSGLRRLRDATRLLDLDARRHILEVGVRGAQLRYRVARRRGEGLLEREPFVLVAASDGGSAGRRRASHSISRCIAAAGGSAPGSAPRTTSIARRSESPPSRIR